MVKLLLSCAMQGILGATFYLTKPTFSEGLGRKKLCCGRDRAPPARRIASKLAPTIVSGQFLMCEATEFEAFAVLSASTS
ncbi:hypothetical protein [Pseudomonas sp. NPDC008258]|uniref:hypothetical protein n=1 Tax=Pseudomonas sp. NPDC008258 TaxID=3364418 RepID=UPI0036F18AE0